MNSFENSDPRKTNWVNSVTVSGITYSYAYKYKKDGIANNAITSPTAMTEYSMVLRLAEQYLIRAEARARQNNIAGGVADLNLIRTRARGSMTGILPDLSNSITQASLLMAVNHERQVELFCEWGHRWFDLKRTGEIENVMSAIASQKGGTWKSYQKLYPISNSDLQQNSSLTGHQNFGY